LRGPIYHVALRVDWEDAVRGGEYRISTRGRDLAQVGFIHASFREQVGAVAASYYADLQDDDLVVLEIEPARLESPVRVEPVGDDRFPHVYGPLPVAAVVAVHPLRAFAGGG
jgi:uncharacterized protein (DUF952 family)